MEEKTSRTAAPSIMIVEDDKDTLEILNVVLQRKFGAFPICTASNGRNGLELFKNRDVDIVISDVNMPEMGGIQMAQGIRAIRPDVQFIFITADTGKAALEHSIGHGLERVQYILKPVSYQELFSAIERSVANVSSKDV